MNRHFSLARAALWLLFYAGLLPVALPTCLDWLSRPSTTWLLLGGLGLLVLAAGVALSVYQVGRALLRRS